MAVKWKLPERCKRGSFRKNYGDEDGLSISAACIQLGSGWGLLRFLWSSRKGTWRWYWLISRAGSVRALLMAILQPTCVVSARCGRRLGPSRVCQPFVLRKHRGRSTLLFLCGLRRPAVDSATRIAESSATNCCAAAGPEDQASRTGKVQR